MNTPPSEQGNPTASSKSLPSKTATKQPIWEIVAEIGTQISDEEWATVPNDASINYKHYLYGQPQKHQ
ncbi:hypothetical protein [Phormidesmis priestleyi]